MLKPFDQITEPDERYAAHRIIEGPQQIRPYELADHYAEIAAIDVPLSVPADVRCMFERARHAFLYSWFDYELSALAEQQALATLECALRLRFAAERATLHALLERAVAKGLFPPMLGAVTLPNAIASIRNSWAHGSATLMGPAMTLDLMGFCAQRIAELYP